MKKLTILPLFLIPVLVLAQVHISGPLSGTLIDTTYIVDENISVEEGDSLIIEAGATLIFNDGVEFDICGYIFADGSETDSIKLINGPGLTWCGIDFNGTSSDSSRLEYCVVTGSSSSGIYCESSSPIITYCTISGNFGDTNGGGINCYASSPSITNCVISGNTTGYGGGGICCLESSNPYIRDCSISGNMAYGWGGGISCRVYSNPSITACVISRNTANSVGGGGIYCSWYSHAAITNCTISGNTANGYGGGIYCSYYSSPDILNTIVEGNYGTYGLFLAYSPNTTITYSDFHNNQNGNFNEPPQGVGTIITVNANGDSCDIFNNIFLDPLFYSTAGDSTYYLTANSPCIDAGDPASPLDPDSTVADMGAFYFNLSLFVIDDLTIFLVGNDVILNWAEIPDAVSYNIYRSNEPYFDIAGMTPIANVSEPQYLDENALSMDVCYYRVTFVIE